LDVFSAICRDVKVDWFWHADHLEHWYGIQDGLSTFTAHHWSVFPPALRVITGVVSTRKQIHSHASPHWRKIALTPRVQAFVEHSTTHDASHQIRNRNERSIAMPSASMNFKMSGDGQPSVVRRANKKGRASAALRAKADPAPGTGY
jgi:hypothetical protein